MKLTHFWNYYLKRTFSKISTWIILLLHLAIAGFIFWTIKEGKGNMQTDIATNNDFFREVFYFQLLIPFLVWTIIFTPISWLLWWQIDDAGESTKTDGTDLFFLSTQVPTSRKQVFWAKVISFSCLLTILHLLFLVLPMIFILWTTNFFAGYSSLQTFSYLAFSFLVIPLFFFLPLVILFFSLCSLKSVWYTVLKWFLRLLPIMGGLIATLVINAIYKSGEIGKKIIIWAHDFWLWLNQNYLLVILVIIGAVFLLACLTLFFAYKKFLEEDLD